MRSLRLPLGIAAVATALALITAVMVGPSSPTALSPTPVTAPADHDRAHQPPASVRTLAVYTDAEPAPSAHPKQMRALLTKGTLPGGVVEATVLTDDDCAADNHGVSHCRNELTLPDGRTITVRHPHRMADVPCMTPGETVRLRRATDA